MPRSTLLAIVAPVLCFISGCAALGREHANEKMGYSIQLPDEWVAGAPDKEQPNITVFESPHISGERFRPTLKILVESTDLGVEEYVEKQKSEVLPHLNAFQLISEEVLEIGKHRRLAYRAEEATTGHRIVCSRDIIVQEGKAYLLTFTASQSQWKNLKDVFVSSAATFKVKQKGDAPSPSVSPLPTGKK